MPNDADWWNAWAPYWEHIENRHASIEATEKFIQKVKSPVLVIGAGHGLIVQHLKEHGFKVDGVDMDPAMIAMANKRRGLEIIQADAGQLPFGDSTYKTVIISTGVVDYVSDISSIRTIINEALRVTAPHSYLFVTFYMLPSLIEKIYRKIGVVEDDRYHMNRIFELYEKRKESPFSCIPDIMKWTGRSYVSTLFYWTKLGLTLPKELKEEDSKVRLIEKLAIDDGKDTKEILRCAPPDIPYRNAENIRELFQNIGFHYERIIQMSDCTIVSYYKSGNVDEKKTTRKIEPRENEKKLLIQVKNLKKKYKGASSNAVDSINLTVEEGMIFGILGPNGAGKTTTLSIMCGLVEKDGGEIKFDEKLSKRGISKALGLVPQDLALYGKLTGRENLKFFGMLYGLKGKKLNSRISALLQMVGLEERADDLVNKFSTGMMRRLNLAAGLLHEPAVILLDEPTVGIDPQSRNCIFESVLKLKSKGTTILYTTHYMEEATRLCDKIAIMDRGKVILEGSPKQAVKDYGLYRADFSISAKVTLAQEKINLLDGVVDVSISDEVLSVFAKDSNTILALVEKISNIAEQHDIDVTFKNIFEPTLESLFLDITGRSLRDSPQENVH